MIAKEELLRIIHEGIRTEEKAAPLYLKHLAVSVRWVGFTDQQCKHIEDTLRSVAGDSEDHKRTLENMRAKVTKGKRDVY